MLNDKFSTAMKRTLRTYKTTPVGKGEGSFALQGKLRTRVRLDSLEPFLEQMKKKHQRTFWKQWEVYDGPFSEGFLQKMIDQQVCDLCSRYVIAHMNVYVCAKCKHTDAGKDYSRQRNTESLRKTWAEDYDKLMEHQRRKSRKRFGTDYPWQSQQVQDKKKANYRKQGIEHHFHKPDVLKKQMDSAMRLKRIKLKGKVYHCQGFEPSVLRAAVKKYGPDSILGQFEDDFESIRLPSGVYRPDFYIVPKSVYVEVKSDYTLLHQNFLPKNRIKAKECAAANVNVRWIVVDRNDVLTYLPEDWWRWKRAELKAFLAASR